MLTIVAIPVVAGIIAAVLACAVALLWALAGAAMPSRRHGVIRAYPVLPVTWVAASAGALAAGALMLVGVALTVEALDAPGGAESARLWGAVAITVAGLAGIAFAVLLIVKAHRIMRGAASGSLVGLAAVPGGLVLLAAVLAALRGEWGFAALTAVVGLGSLANAALAGPTGRARDAARASAPVTAVDGNPSRGSRPQGLVED
ncbi:hypothetical protein [Demequina sp. NBRC 110056]|uniref:hypothetical protein n=1 Tax=Demequina sp. NBRC 110056 TaxID=1570345 RepID=UPI000A03DA71|nr:hypothetical protein [Demequina sp. NBRC 110056]